MGTLSELSRPEIYAMGNICSIIAKEKKVFGIHFSLYVIFKGNLRYRFFLHFGGIEIRRKFYKIRFIAIVPVGCVFFNKLGKPPKNLSFLA